jgi:hypothetical protein
MYIMRGNGNKFRRSRLRRTAATHMQCRMKEGMYVPRRPVVERRALIRVTGEATGTYLTITRSPATAVKDKGDRYGGVVKHFEGRVWVVTCNVATSQHMTSPVVVGFDSLPHAQAERDALEYHYARFLLTRKDK